MIEDDAVRGVLCLDYYIFPSLGRNYAQTDACDRCELLCCKFVVDNERITTKRDRSKNLRLKEF